MWGYGQSRETGKGAAVLVRCKGGSLPKHVSSHRWKKQMLSQGVDLRSGEQGSELRCVHEGRTHKGLTFTLYVSP